VLGQNNNLHLARLSLRLGPGSAAARLLMSNKTAFLWAN
jgi:hypothetical protein